MSGLTNEMRLSKMAHDKPLVRGDEKIAVFGAGGQIGTKLKPLLEKLYKGKVIYCEAPAVIEKRPSEGFVELDVRNREKVKTFLKNNKVKVVINLAALLSGAAARDPKNAYEINVDAGRKLLDIQRDDDVDVDTVMMMSSMAIQEFDQRRFDSQQEKEAMKLLKANASPTLVRKGLGAYAIHKSILEDEARLQSLVFNKNVVIPRLAGVLNCHVPFPSDGTTEAADRAIVVAAMQEVYPEDWEQRVRKLIEPVYLEKGQYLKDGYYVPEVPADTKFDMVDGKTLAEASLMLLHQDLRGQHDIAAPGPVHCVSEYSLSMRQVYDVLHDINPNLKMKFAAETTDFSKPLADGLDRGKTSRAACWPTGQSVDSTVGLIGEFRRGYDPEKSREENDRAIADRSIRENYGRVVEQLRAQRQAEMNVSVAPKPDDKHRAV